MKHYILIGILNLLLCVKLYAQPAPSTKNEQSGNSSSTDSTYTQQTTDHKKPPLDGYYEKTNILNARVASYAPLREADVFYSKRIWREIDLREKLNQYLGSPTSRLIDVIIDAINLGELTAYDATPSKEDPDGDEFTKPLKPSEVLAKLADSVLVDEFDPVTGEKTNSVMKPGDFNPDSVCRYRIKEDWIFDKQRSVFEPRIVGIAPMVKYKAGGVAFDYQPAFWIYYSDARKVLAVHPIVNRFNDATGLSFDDAFVKRIFSSYIVKESNDRNERIKDYIQDPIERLRESERIKKKLMDYEHDLWVY